MVACKRRWKGLKDSYIKELRIIKKAELRGLPKKKKYIYYEHLSFLTPKSRINVGSPTRCGEDCPCEEYSSASEDDISNQEVAETSKDANRNDFSVDEIDSSSDNAEVAKSDKDARRDRTTNDGKYSSSETTAELTWPSKKVSCGRTIAYEIDLSSDIPDDEKTAQPSKTTRENNKRKIDGTQRYRPDVTKERSEGMSVMPQDEDTLFCLSMVSDFKRISDNLKCDAKCEILHVLQNYKMYSSRFYGSLHEPRNSSHQPCSSFTNALSKQGK